MAVKVDPFLLPIPKTLQADPETRGFFEYFIRWAHDITQRTGGGNDLIDQADFGELNNAISYQAVDDAAPHVVAGPVDEPSAFIDRPVIDAEPAALHVSFPSTIDLPMIELASGATALTTSVSSVIVCLNSAAATVTLNAYPVDGEDAIICRRDALVTVSGDINGATSLLIGSKYDTAHLKYSLIAGEWMII